MLESATDEKNIGLEVFYTSTKGIGGRLRAVPEDFRVEEVPLLPPEKPNGRYVIARVQARNWETNRLIDALARGIGIDRRCISFAGTKDKRAVTVQYMSFKASLDAVENCTLPDVVISHAYMAEQRLKMGSLIGNRFEIKVRDTELEGSELRDTVSKTKGELRALAGFPNFFGVQRFGAVRPITHLVGRSIVEGDFKRAVMLYLSSTFGMEDRGIEEARKCAGKGDYEGALALLPSSLRFERRMLEHLRNHPDDFIGALTYLPLNLLRMFVHAYQAYLFNRILSERIRRRLPINEAVAGDIVIPQGKHGLPDTKRMIFVTEANIGKVNVQCRKGRAYPTAPLFGMEGAIATGEMGDIEHRIIEREGIDEENFHIPEMPKLSAYGTRRALISHADDLTITVLDNMVDFSFSLKKGCYATSLLREFMKASILRY